MFSGAVFDHAADALLRSFTCCPRCGFSQVEGRFENFGVLLGCLSRDAWEEDSRRRIIKVFAQHRARRGVNIGLAARLTDELGKDSVDPLMGRVSCTERGRASDGVAGVRLQQACRLMPASAHRLQAVPGFRLYTGAPWLKEWEQAHVVAGEVNEMLAFDKVVIEPQ